MYTLMALSLVVGLLFLWIGSYPATSELWLVFGAILTFPTGVVALAVFCEWMIKTFP